MPAPTRCSFALLTALLLVAPVRADDPADHWAWKKPTRPAVPAGAANPIDAFVRAKLEGAKLKPAAPATREQLIRRATYDLTGLPPTPEEIDAFVKDKSPDAWATVVDRLLASPRYGERWGRHWLDLARYADTNGYEFDEPRPDAWRYRDYVIRSFNADKPFDRFVIEQLAGDEAFPNDPDALIATGFNLLGPDMTDSSDQAQRRLNTLNDMTDTAALAFLGMTVACARCHDHKFEPIPQTDYFRLQAFFVPAAFRRDLPVATKNQLQAHASATAAYLERTKELREGITAIEEPQRKKLYEAKLAKLPDDVQAAFRTPPEKRTGGQLELVANAERRIAVTEAEVTKAFSPEEKIKIDALRAKLKTFDAQKPAALPVATGLTDQPGPPPKTFLLERGELLNKGAEVQPGFLTALSPGAKEVPVAIAPLTGSTGRRLALAKWVASKDNPLTSRVIVNRLWQHHFGRGVVATTSDFGVRGARPTHPELLDWLAVELQEPTPPAPLPEGKGEKEIDDPIASSAREGFISPLPFREGGPGGVGSSVPWSLKRMHRLMLLSETYQQSTLNPDAAPLDPDNKLFSRATRKRLEGEAVRDSLLVVSGRLNPKAGGPGVVLPHLTKPAGGSRPVTGTADPKEHARRAVYLFNRRNLRDPFLEAFDLPDSNLSCPKREKSTTAPQALALLNSPEAMAAAKALADRLEKEAKTEGERIALAYRLALGRSPTAKETERATAFLKDSPLSELCRALLNLNEFVYLD